MIDKLFLLADSLGLGSLTAGLLGEGNMSLSRMLFVVFSVLAVFLYGLTLGKTRVFMSLLAIYIAFAFDVTFPYLGELYRLTSFPKEQYILRIIVFLLVYVLACMFMDRSFLKNKFSLKDFSFWSSTIMNVVQVVFLTSIVVSFMPTEMGENYLGWTFAYIGSQNALFFWTVLPLVLLPFFKRHKEVVKPE